MNKKMIINFAKYKVLFENERNYRFPLTYPGSFLIPFEIQCKSSRCTCIRNMCRSSKIFFVYMYSEKVYL